MREIKFRAWNVEFGLYWDNFAMSSNGHAYDMCYGNVAASYKKEDVLLEQFTGLLDKNGKEIYEGDIVKIEYIDAIVGVVAFDSVLAEYYLKVKSECQKFHLSAKEIRVLIGNIHENPGLLTRITA